MKKSKQLVTLILASLFLFISVKGMASEFNFASKSSHTREPNRQI